LVLIQARINWEGVKVGMAEVQATINQDGVAVHPEDGKQRYDIWVSPRGCPHMPTQTGGRETQPKCSTTLC